LKEIMDEKTQELLNDVKSGVVEELKKEVGVIVANEMKGVEASIRDIKKSEENPEDKKAEQALKFFQAQYRKDILGEVTKDLDTETEASGLELVPEYFGSEVIRIASKYGVARQNARVITLPGKTFNLPTMGSVTAYRTDEGGAILASSPTTGQLTFTAKKLAGLVVVTTELIEDANIDVLNYIAGLCGEAIAQKEDQWAFLGLTGTEGIFRNTDVQVSTLGSGDITYASVTFDDIATALGLLDDAIVDNAVIAGSWSIFNALRVQKDENGQYIYQNPGASMPNSIWGLPYVKSTVFPKTTDSGSQADEPFMAIYDPRYLMIGDRRNITLEFSKEATVTSSDGETSINLFEQDMVAIKVTERLDIQLAEADKAFVRIETSAS
jgi:HK97 family phage major capsid protein